MNPRAAAAAVAAVVFAVPLLVILFLMGDDENPCPSSGSTATTPPGGGELPPGTTKVWPIKSGDYMISDTFDNTGANGHRIHLGADLAAPAGTPIYAAMDGVVAAAGEASGFGDWIVLNHNDGNGGVISTVYGHMYPQDLLVSAGGGDRPPDTVKAGQQIARVGSNGESSGAHLHFEVVPGGRMSGGKQIDPIPWLTDAGQPGGGAPQTQTPATPTTTSGLAQQAAAATDPNATTTPPSTAASVLATTTSPACGQSTPGGGVDNLAEGTVPAEYEPWYRKAGQMCPQISSAMLASQGQAESGFNPNAQSNVNPPALGIAQFLQGTANALADDGQPYVRDENGDGTGSVWDPPDAIMGQARYMCDIARHVDAWIADGSVSDTSDRRVLYLAAYNAGEGAVRSSHGFPTGSPDYEIQTRPYCDKIIANIPAFTKTLS